MGLKSLITVMTHTGENGLDINISDTPLEDAKKNEAAIDRLLDELGIKDAGARGMLDQAVGLYRGETADDGLPTEPAEPASPKLVDDLLTAYTYISPDGGTADLDRTMELAKAFLGELSMYKLVSVSESPTPESAPPESAPPEASPTGTPATPTPASAPTPTPAGPSSPGSSLTMEDIAGHYSLTGTQTDYLDGKPEVESSRLSCYIEIDGQGRLLYVTGYGEYRTEVVLNRDAGADTWRYEDPWADWFTEYGTLTFHRESGGIRLDLVIEQIDNTQKDVESKWDLSGMKD